MRRGEFVILEVEGREPVRGFVALASSNGESLILMFDALLDGCVGAMPVSLEPSTGIYRNVMTGHAIGIRPVPS